MIIPKKLDMLFLLMRKEIWFYIGINILIIYNVNAQYIEVQDSIKNRTLKSIRVYSISKDSKNLVEENLYDEKGQIIQETVYKRGVIERKTYSRQKETGLLQYIITINNGKPYYTVVIYDSIPGIIPFDSVKTFIEKFPDSINSVLHYNLIRGRKVINQESVYSRTHFGRINLFNYNNSNGKLMREETYIYRNEKELLPMTRIEDREYNKQGKVVKSSLRLFPADLNTISNYTLDEKGREIQIANQQENGLLSLKKIKYEEAKHKKVVQLLESGKLKEEKIYSMDEYGNYLTLRIAENNKNGKKIEVIYEYH